MLFRSAESSTGGSKSAPLAKAVGKTISKTASRKAKKRQQLENAFKDYFEYHEPISKAPPHRILAVNRGERAKVLRVRIEADTARMLMSAEKIAVPEGHPYREFLGDCLKDAIVRLMLPSLERESRRELTERAEQHAVDVFVRNLRKLFLQPPVRGRRVLAIDPGFRSGCKVACVDEFGAVLLTDAIYIVEIGRAHV